MAEKEKVLLTTSGASRPSDLRIEIEERFQARTQLFLDVFLAAFEDVHGDMRVAAIRQLDRRLANLGDVLRWKQPHAIDQRQICHTSILRLYRGLPRTEQDLRFRFPAFLS